MLFSLRVRCSRSLTITLYALISSKLASDRIACFGLEWKYTAPPPRNGSKYLLNSEGKYSANWFSNCDFPPAHFRKGKTSTLLVSTSSRPCLASIENCRWSDRRSTVISYVFWIYRLILCFDISWVFFKENAFR